MDIIAADSRPAWQVKNLKSDLSWRFTLSETAGKDIAEMIKTVFVSGKHLFEYEYADFDFSSSGSIISAAVNEAHHGRGIALMSGLPRDALSEAQFELLSWAIGLHIGVARPQTRDSRYISRVSNVGTDYRAATGRGYSSNAALDFHVDGADLTTLACYNKAQSGGQSMVVSSVSARNQMVRERPDLAQLLHADYYYSRQGEQAEDEREFYAQPIFDVFNQRVFGKWNRNRLQTAQNLAGVPQLKPEQIEALELLDEILMRKEFLYTMYLEPGDLQIMNNYLMLHSRTEFIDFDNPAEKRLLFRLWLTPPDAIRLPPSWEEIYRTVEPATVRGGFRGQQYDEACRAFERRQARVHNMYSDA